MTDGLKQSTVDEISHAVSSSTNCFPSKVRFFGFTHKFLVSPLNFWFYP